MCCMRTKKEYQKFRLNWVFGEKNQTSFYKTNLVMEDKISLLNVALLQLKKDRNLAESVRGVYLAKEDGV